MKDTYGVIAWRWKSPRRTKALYRLGELTPAARLPALPGPQDDGGTAAKTPRRTPTKPPRGRSNRRPGARSRTKRRTVPNVDDLIPAGRRIAADADERGEPLTRDRLAIALRQAGTSAGNHRVGALLARLKDETDRPAQNQGARQ